MKNVNSTASHSLYDHVFARAVRSVSRIVSVRKLSQPFWSRWRGGEIEDQALFDFLGTIRNFDDWPAAAIRIVENEKSLLEADGPPHDPAEKVKRLRRLSFICNIGQWGCLPINGLKIQTYTRCRDFYIEAEKLAFGDRYHRIRTECAGKQFFANVHLPQSANRRTPVIVILHGIDGCKEEHFATEQALVESGFVVVGVDGPGQAEALFVDKICWNSPVPEILSSLLDTMEQLEMGDTRNVGLLGISFGALWAYQCASEDTRIKAIYDLGAPVNSESFARVPFLLKTRIYQAFGVETEAEIQAHLKINEINDPDLLARIKASVRIVHGTNDRFVPEADKIFLKDTLNLNSGCDVSYLSFEDGHCCTNHGPELREDFSRFFLSRLGTAQEGSRSG